MSGSNPYRVHALVCLGGKSCPAQGSEAIWFELKRRVLEAGLENEIRVTKSGCLGQCGHGPMIVVYPENVWYAAVRAEDVQEIVESHLLGGKPVERLLYRPGKPGPNVVAKASPKAAH